MIVINWITSAFTGLLGALAKWAGLIAAFASGAYWRENKAKKKNLEIAKEQLKIANRRKLRRDELLALASKRKR